MAFDLSQLNIQTSEILDQLELLTAGLEPAQANWQPAPTRWSVAQCIQHLNTFNGPHLNHLEAVIATGQPARGKAGTYPWWERWFMWLEEPPPKFRLPTPASLQPASSLDLSEVVAEFRGHHQQLLQLADQARHLDWVATRAPVGFLPRVRMSLGTQLALVLVHDRRHLYQMGQVLAHPQFPAEEES
jgi:hypothetical protein